MRKYQKYQMYHFLHHHLHKGTSIEIVIINTFNTFLSPLKGGSV